MYRSTWMVRSTWRGASSWTRRYGGRGLWAREDGTAIVQLVAPGQWEKRYCRRLSIQQWAEIDRLVTTHDLVNLHTPERNGVPDEARPSITLFLRDAGQVCVSKW